MIKESTQEVVGRKAKSASEKRRKHHNFFGIGCWDVLSCGRSPLEHDPIWEKAIFD
jgi:hypothetical protein